MKFFKKTLLTFILLKLNVLTIHAQNANKIVDSLGLDTLKTYTELDEALQNPQKVYKLVLKKSKLKRLPPELFKLVNLKYLDVSKNKLLEVPKEIASLKNLEYLDLSKNKLTTLPPEIGELKNLHILMIGETELYGLPPALGRLNKLEYLDAWNSYVNVFPDELTGLKNLKTLDLRLINVSENDRMKLQKMLPNTTIEVSPICPCQNH